MAADSGPVGDGRAEPDITQRLGVAEYARLKRAAGSQRPTQRLPKLAPRRLKWTDGEATLYPGDQNLCGDGVTGFMPPAMPDAAWVLNAMYEHEQGPADMSHHEYHQACLADRRTLPHIVAGIDLDAVGVATGGGLGRAQHPGPGWRRLRWAELARRTGDPVVPHGLMPSYRCFPSAKKEGSWPLGIIPPTEGSLDRETWNRLITILTQYSPAGPDTRCLAYYNPLMLGATDFDNLHVRAGRLGDAEILYDQSEADFSPSNLWADDRSWVLCTDYDLWATKIAGPPALISAMLNDFEIEAVRLPWAHS